MPLYRRLPKRGFNSLYKREKNVAINLDKITKLIEAKKLDSSKSIDLRKFLLKAKKPSKLKVKVLGSGDIKIKISILADKFSETAKSKIEKAGGSAEIIK